MTRIERSQLVVGQEYYFSSTRNTKGIYQGRENGMIYFTPIVKGAYSTIQDSYQVDHPEYSEIWKDCVYFCDDNELDGFEPVIE